MNHFFIYSIKAGVFMALFYIVYYLFLSNDTAYVRNRIYLLATLVISWLLPLITIRTSVDVEPDTVTGIIVNILSASEAPALSDTDNSARVFGLMHYISRVWFAGIIIMFTRLLFSITTLLLIVLRNKPGGSIVTMKESSGASGFSALGYIFVKDGMGENERDKIILHETIHNGLKHHFDIMLMEIVLTLQWMNPFIYLIRYSLRSVHEYHTDREFISSTGTIVEYQKLLMNEIFGTGNIPVASCFSSTSLIKKRILMMSKKETRPGATVKVLIAAPVIALFVILFSCSVYNDSADLMLAQQEKQELVKAEPESRDVFMIVEEMPTFLGGDVQAFATWVKERVVYPEKAKKDGIQGKVYIGFVIEPDGSLTTATVLRGVEPSIDAEAVRVVNLSPKWKPGVQRGVNVPVRFSITMNFELKP